MSFVQPYTKTVSPLLPGRVAHVVIDAQNDFLHADGWYAKSGVDISHMQRVIEPTRRLNVECRRRSIPIVWTRHGFRDERDGGMLVRLRPFLKAGGLRVGTWGHQLLDELEPQPEDWYVEKSRLSAFYQTNLESVLRNLGAETVIFTGVLTNQCVAATSKDAAVALLFRRFPGRLLGRRRRGVPARYGKVFPACPGGPGVLDSGPGQLRPAT